MIDYYYNKMFIFSHIKQLVTCLRNLCKKLIDECKVIQHDVIQLLTHYLKGRSINNIEQLYLSVYHIIIHLDVTVIVFIR